MKPARIYCREPLKSLPFRRRNSVLTTYDRSDVDCDSDDERQRSTSWPLRLDCADGRHRPAVAPRVGRTARALHGGSQRRREHPTESRGWRHQTQTRRSRGSGNSTTGSGQPFAEVLPAVGTQLPIDGYPLDARLVAHELARRARLVLDFEDHLVAGTLLGEFLATHRTGVHLVSHGGSNK